MRLILAAFVVVEHCALSFGGKLLPGNMAVELFFIISGFYMAFILDGKYATSDLRGAGRFYLSRFFRLWPTFILTTLAVHGWWLLNYLRLGHAPQSAGPVLEWANSATVSVLVHLSNFLMIGQEVSSLFHVSATKGAVLSFGPPEPLPDGSLWLGTTRNIGQAWSIGAEIWFYLLAPLLVRTPTRWLLALMAAGLVLRFYIEDVRNLLAYFFFPAQLPLFLVGVLVYRYRRALAWRSAFIALIPYTALFTATAGFGGWVGIRTGSGWPIS